MTKYVRRVLAANELGNRIILEAWIEAQSVELNIHGPNSHMQNTLTLQETTELKLLLEELLDG